VESPVQINRQRLSDLPPAKRKEAEQALASLEKALQANPLLRYNNPQFGPVHKKQIRFHELVAEGISECAYFAGNQGGKTTSGIVDCLIQALPWELVPDHLKRFKKHTPPFRCRIAAQGREEIEDFIFEKIREWCPPAALVGDSFRSAYDKQHHVLHFKNGSYFSFKTYAQEAQQWGGSTLDRVLMDEEPGPQHLQEARIRVMRREGQLLFTMTPVEGLTHIYDSFESLITEMESNGEGEAREGDARAAIFADMDDNPWLTEKAKEQALRGLSNEELKARKEGKFVALTGLIYSDFDPQVHVVPGLTKLPENVNVVVGIDPGIRYACAVGWFYLKTDDTMVMFDEGYFKDMTIKEVCDRIHRTNGYWGCEPMYYVIDPAAKNRNSQTGRSDQMEFADHGIPTIAGQNSVTAGINRCRERLQNQRFFVTENCRNFQKEIRTYRWKKPPRNAESDGREIPVKKDDHLLDEWRLVCMSRPAVPEETIRKDETPGQTILREHLESVTNPQGISVA